HPKMASAPEGRHSFAPPGLGFLLPVHPGLTPWAINYRPSGANAGRQSPIERRRDFNANCLPACDGGDTVLAVHRVRRRLAAVARPEARLRLAGKRADREVPVRRPEGIV